MSFLSDLLGKRVTPAQFVEESIGYVAAAFGSKEGPMAYVAADALASAKSSASQAITVADTEMGPLLAASASALEVFLDAELAKYTGGLSVVANPLINTGIDTAANMLTGVIDAWALKTKAGLAPKVAVPQPVPSPVLSIK